MKAKSNSSVEYNNMTKCVGHQKGQKTFILTSAINFKTVQLAAFDSFECCLFDISVALSL